MDSSDGNEFSGEMRTRTKVVAMTMGPASRTAQQRPLDLLAMPYQPLMI